MKKINHILFIMAATAALMIAGCRKDNPDDKTGTDETITADFDLTILDYRGWNPKLYTWTWKDGALHTDDQKIQTLDITSDKRLVLLATSGDTQFKGVHFDVPDFLPCQTPFYVMTAPRTGITPEDAMKVIEILNS